MLTIKAWLVVPLALLSSVLVIAGGASESGTTGTTTTTATMTSGRYQEAPMLAAMVASGELPPVEDRLPDEPQVLEALEEVGTYGGTLEVFAHGNHPWVDAGDSPERSQYPLRMNFDGSIVADQARGFELSDDQMTFTLFLRPGMKWSNGDPFYADDFVFKQEMDQDEAISTWGLPGQLDSVTAIDDYTVRYRFSVPYPRIVLDMLHWRGSDWRAYAPSTWLKQWHIEYNADANAKARAEGFDSWSAALNDHYSFEPVKDINKPTMHPWKWEELTTTVRIWERNPYYYAVDTAGQQLPYIDRVVSQTVNFETYKLKVVAGEADYAVHMELGDFPLLKQNEQSGDYQVQLFTGMNGANVSYTFGLAHRDLVKRELFNNIDFRRAMSLAIDRDEINEAVWLGQAVPRQATINSDASFYQPEWGEQHPYARYDVAEANRLLDRVGLQERNRDGVRLMKNGEPLSLTLVHETGAEGATELRLLSHELVKEDWEAVGVRVQITGIDRDSMRAAEMEGTVDVRSSVQQGIEMYDYLSGNSSMLGAGPRGPGQYYAYWQAEQAAKASGGSMADLPGEKPPPEFARLYRLARVELQSTLYGSPEYMRIREQIYDLHAEQLWTIGVVGQAPFPIVSRSNLRNMPSDRGPWWEAMLTTNYYSNMFFFAN